MGISFRYVQVEHRAGGFGQSLQQKQYLLGSHLFQHRRINSGLMVFGPLYRGGLLALAAQGIDSGPDHNRPHPGVQGGFTPVEPIYLLENL